MTAWLEKGPGRVIITTTRGFSLVSLFFLFQSALAKKAEGLLVLTVPISLSLSLPLSSFSISFLFFFFLFLLTYVSIAIYLKDI